MRLRTTFVHNAAYDEMLSIFEQTCHGLEAAHRTGVVHRDLKPENVFPSHAVDMVPSAAESQRARSSWRSP